MLCLDSTVLAYVLKLLNERHKYGLDLQLLSVDEGITGYRDDSLEVIVMNGSRHSETHVGAIWQRKEFWFSVSCKFARVHLVTA